jgi:PLP dependent protein
MDIVQNLNNIRLHLPDTVSLVAVSKTKPASMILDLHRAGHHDFGENKVQDLTSKAEELPDTIKWHFIGHLQSNKVKYIAPFVHLIHGVDSLKLLKVIEKEGQKLDLTINCLLQVHIADEKSKFGLSESEIQELLASDEYAGMEHVRIKGLMGMATYTDDIEQVRQEFKNLKRIFEGIKNDFFKDRDYFRDVSMGMSGDYNIAIEEGSTMIRVGSLIFGPRNY